LTAAVLLAAGVDAQAAAVLLAVAARETAVAAVAADRPEMAVEADLEAEAGREPFAECSSLRRHSTPLRYRK